MPDFTRPADEPDVYEIRVQGHLDDRWADSVEGMAFRRELDGTTALTGQLADQAALHGVLNRMRDLGISIVSVQRLDPQAHEDGGSRTQR